MQLQYPALLQSRLFINNEWISTAHTFPVTNPATRHTITEVADAGEKECLAAIAAASAAFETWSRLTAKERSTLLMKWYQLIMQHTADLALLLTTEQGKPLSEALWEVQYGASFIEWNAEESKRCYGEVIPAPVAGKRLITIKQPVGVVAAITPWNFPIAMITRKIAPALAAGCAVVLKPAAQTPLSALALACLALEAGLPPGVLNILPASQPAVVGEILTTHPVIKKLSFTGSTATGKLLMAQCATTVKRLSLELGGNAPSIIFDDADIPTAVNKTLTSKYRNAGQTCVCTNRILVQRSIYPAFMEAYTRGVKALQVGDGTTPGTDIGPLIDAKAKEKVERLLKDAVAKGASIVTGGNTHPQGALFFEPTIITGCNQEMALAQEEIFGPVASVFLFDTEEEAIAMANDTAYGLAAYFFSGNINRCIRVAEQLHYGMVGINEGLISHAEAPFGGVKESGFGKEGSFYGLEEYLETKYVCIGGL